MLRSRVALIPRRHFTTTTRLLDRPPTFTTPSPLPPSPPPLSSSDSLASTTSKQPQEQLPPLPPTNLPVEDYASPLLHTASFFSSLFRYAVYGSVGIVSLAVAGLVGVHLYVEHAELALPPQSSQDPDEWLSEIEGWSGAHTGKGGTDPRLGLLARAAVRGAWISQQWGTGSALGPVQNHQATFGVNTKPGGAMIGAQQAQASRGTPVNDAGWAMAESYLVFAMRKAQEKGISLVEPADWETRVEQGGVDRAAVELEERLAGLRERIGGRIKLELARDGWERIYLALAASPTTDVSTPEKKKLAEWEQREKVTASRKLGELGGRIAELWGKDTEEGQQEAARARGWFVGGLVPILAGAEGVRLDGSELRTLERRAESSKHVSPSSSFFSFWSRSHPPTTTASSSSPDSQVSQIASLLPSAPTSLPPSTSRAVLSSLVSLETFLARTASDLASAQSVQSSALDYARSLSSLSSSTAPQQSTGLLAHSPLPPSTLPQASKLLTSLFLTTRVAVLETHLAECSLAISQSKRRSTTSALRDVALKRLHSARESAQSVLLTLPPPSSGVKDDDKKKEIVFAKQLSGVDQKVREVLEGQSRRIRRDADKVDQISTHLIEFLNRQK